MNADKTQSHSGKKSANGGSSDEPNVSESGLSDLGRAEASQSETGTSDRDVGDRLSESTKRFAGAIADYVGLDPQSTGELAESAVAAVRSTTVNLKRQSRRASRSLKKGIGDHPLTATLVALGAGIMVGVAARSSFPRAPRHS